MAIAIVLAGGSGSRMNSDVAKQYLLLDGKEVLYYSLKTFQDNKNISDIILVARPEDTDYCKSNIVAGKVSIVGSNFLLKVSYFEVIFCHLSNIENNRDVAAILADESSFAINFECWETLFEVIEQIGAEGHLRENIVVDFCLAIVPLGDATAHESIDVTFSCSI